MVLRFTAKVKKREVVVQGVDLPDGATVDVTIDPQTDDEEVWDPTPEEWAMIKESEAAFRRGEYYRGEDFSAWLRGGPEPVLVRDELAVQATARTRAKAVGARTRKRAERPARRTRKRD